MPMTPHQAQLLAQRTAAVEQGVIDPGQAALIGELQALRSELAADRRWRASESPRLKWRVMWGIVLAFVLMYCVTFVIRFTLSGMRAYEEGIDFSLPASAPPPAPASGRSAP